MTKLRAVVFYLFLVWLNRSFGQTPVDNHPAFSAEQLKADLKYLKTKLEDNHPGLYLYSSKQIIDRTFDSLENGISSPMTATAFYRHITILSSIIKDGHTLILPQQDDTNSFLPYHAVIMDNRLFVDMAYTSDTSIPEGSEIISINNLGADKIISQLTERQVRDGYNLTYPTWILSNYFRQYYSFVFGCPEYFTISYKINEKTNTALIKALTKDSIFYYRQRNYPGRIFSAQPGEALKLKVDTMNNYAVLTIKDFHNDVLKKEYKQNFEKVTGAYFEQINNSRVENLVIDLRNNQGGDVENGVYLLSWLLDKPFSVVKEYWCVKNNTLQNCHGPSFGEHKPKAGNFRGHLYVLINGGSFSNSGIVSSCLQAHNRATFIGQETGGNPDVIAGYSKDFTLPNTKIEVQIPTKQFVITGKENNNGRGIMPAHFAAPTLKDLLENKDRELDYTIELIKRKDKTRQQKN